MSHVLLSLTRRVLTARAAALLGALALAAAGTDVSAQARTEPLRIGYQKYGTLTVLKARGDLEKRLAPLGIDVQWTEFPAGPQLLEGLNVGSIDFGTVGEAPPIFAQAAGAPTRLRRPPAAGAAGRGDRRAEGLAAEARRRPQGQEGRAQQGLATCTTCCVKRAGEGRRWPTATCRPSTCRRPTRAPPSRRGSVDAWVIWDPFLAAAEKQLGARVLADGTRPGRATTSSTWPRAPTPSKQPAGDAGGVEELAQARRLGRRPTPSEVAAAARAADRPRRSTSRKSLGAPLRLRRAADRRRASPPAAEDRRRLLRAEADPEGDPQIADALPAGVNVRAAVNGETRCTSHPRLAPPRLAAGLPPAALWSALLTVAARAAEPAPAAAAHRLPEERRQPGHPQAAGRARASASRDPGAVDRVPGRPAAARSAGGRQPGLRPHRRLAAGVRAGRRQGPASTSAPSRPSRAARRSWCAPDSPLADAGRPEGHARSRCSAARARTTCWCARWRRPACSGATSSRSTWRRPMRARPSSAAASTPGRSGTRSTRPPRSTSSRACWRPASGLSGNNSFYLASRAFAREHPQALLHALFEELTRADA